MIERSQTIANTWALEHQNHQELFTGIQLVAQKAYEQGMRDTFKMVVNILENPPMPQPMFQITLQAARISCGYSVEEAAKLLHVNPDRLKRLEEDNSELSTSLALKIGNLYGVSLDFIYIGPESDGHKRNREMAQARNLKIAK